MKCIRCGQQVPDNTKVCKNCGFNFDDAKKYYYVEKKEDPEVDPNKKSSLIDNPILTFVFGIISIIVSLLFINYQGYVVIYFIFSILAIIFTFIMSKKPTKVSLIPARNFGKILAYIASVLVLFKTVYFILGILL